MNEIFRDYAFHYRALCLRWKKGMAEKEMIQAILRNCNPRLASLLRGNLQSFHELVRVGMQVERDTGESKKYWNMMNADEQRKKNVVSQESQRRNTPSYTRLVQNFKEYLQSNPRNLTIPLIIQGKQIAPLVDTGSIFNAKVPMESVVQGVNFVIKRRANVSSGQRQSSSCSREGTLDNKTP